jgi:hypothetical protein
MDPLNCLFKPFEVHIEYLDNQGDGYSSLITPFIPREGEIIKTTAGNKYVVDNVVYDDSLKVGGLSIELHVKKF